MTPRVEPEMSLLDAVNEARAGQDLMVRCQAHDDNRPSLHVSPGTGSQPVVLECFAGCKTEAILEAVNLEWSDICAPRDDVLGDGAGEWTPAGPASHVYQYADEKGAVLYEVLRVPLAGGRKTFFQRLAAGPDGKHTWKLGDIRRVLYRLPLVIEAVRTGNTIYITEGEKDADSLYLNMGLVATCNPMGAGNNKWLPEFSQVLAGADVVIVSDADEPGRAHARQVRESLIEVGCRVEVREAVPPHKDVTEHLQAGNTVEQLMVTVPAEDAQRQKFGIDVLDFIRREFDPDDWVIPGTMARRERLLLTGFEGLGKSTLLRQIACCVSAGINPFTLRKMEPKKVLVIDAENEGSQTLSSWQHLVGLCEFYDSPIDRGMLTILEEWDNPDLDFTTADGTAWLHERIHGYAPDLCVLGPITNVVGRDVKEDEPVRKLRAAINSARAINGTAFILEHHAPHKAGGEKQRSVRPYGSSLFLRWPDYGYGLLPNEDKEGLFKWQRTRFPRVRSRIWPDALRWGDLNGNEFPWVEDVWS